MFERTKRFASKRAEKTLNYGKRLTNYEELKGHGDWIASMLDALKPSRKPAREETFAAAYQRLNLTEEQLAQAYRHYQYEFFLFATLGSLAVGVFFHSAFSEGGWGMLTSLGFLAIASAILFRSSFRALQIEKRELVDVSYWLQHPERWLPMSGPGKPKSSSRAMKPSSSKSSRKPNE